MSLFNLLKSNQKSTSPRIYLDTASGTGIDQEVLDAITTYQAQSFGNPSSLHQEGNRAKEDLHQARQAILDFLGDRKGQLIFTASGTEANNLAVFGSVWVYEKKQIRAKGSIVTSSLEHLSIVKPVENLASRGWSTVTIKVDEKGELDFSSLKAVLEARLDVVLISLIYGHNEIGTVWPIADIGQFVEKLRIKRGSVYPLFHIDACQAPRFLDLQVAKLKVDLMTLNGSKVYGPKGVGALYVKAGINLEPFILGGGQEGGLRSGTENVAGAIGLARALKLCAQKKDVDNLALVEKRDWLEQELIKAIPGIVIHGRSTNRLPHNLNFTVPEVESELLLIALDELGFAVSTGSACSLNKDRDNRILTVLYGQAPKEASVRLSLDRKITKKDLQQFLTAIIKIINRQRDM